MKTATLTQTAISVLFPRKQETSNYKYTFSQPRRIVKLRLDYSKRFFFYLKETALHIINIDLEDEKLFVRSIQNFVCCANIYPRLGSSSPLSIGDFLVGRVIDNRFSGEISNSLV